MPAIPATTGAACQSRRCRHAPTVKRRRFIAASAIAAAVLSTGRVVSADAETIPQPAVPGAAAFLERAFEMRRMAVDLGDQPYGAVVVRDGRIIGQSWSRVILDQDPTAHAELAAIRDTARRLQDRDLTGAVLYSSSRPCVMCEAAAYWAGISDMVHGRQGTNAGAPGLCR